MTNKRFAPIIFFLSMQKNSKIKTAKICTKKSKKVNLPLKKKAKKNIKEKMLRSSVKTETNKQAYIHKYHAYNGNYG